MLLDVAPPPSTDALRVLRPARALVGWLSGNKALQMLSHARDGMPPEEKLARIRAAQAAVAARPAEINQADAITDPPEALSDYIKTLLDHPVMEQFRAEGWSVRLADLRRLCCVQPAVFLDHAADRAGAAVRDDMVSLAKITIPMEHSASDFATAYDDARHRFVLTSRNPNFRIVGAFQNSVPSKGQTGFAFGFINMTTLSFMQVARHRGRYMLRDGNHRALGLLASGIHTVPVLYREYGDFDSLELSSGLFTAKTYLGERPPLLCDYLDERVSMAAEIPAVQKVVIIQAIETSLLG